MKYVYSSLLFLVVSLSVLASEDVDVHFNISGGISPIQGDVNLSFDSMKLYETAVGIGSSLYGLRMIAHSCTPKPGIQKPVVKRKKKKLRRQVDLEQGQAYQRLASHVSDSDDDQEEIKPKKVCCTQRAQQFVTGCCLTVGGFLLTLLQTSKLHVNLS